MTVRSYSSINEYLDENLHFLEKKEAVNNLLIGIPSSLKNIKDLHPYPVLLSVLNGNEVVFTSVQTPPKNLLIYGLEKSCALAIEQLIDFILKNKITLPGVIGPKNIATVFAEKWRVKKQAEWKVNFEQLVYRLDKMEKIKYVNGFLRKATMQELDFLAEWAYFFTKEAMGDGDRKEAAERTKNTIKKGNLFLWENGGKVVSMAGVSRPTRNGITVNYVYTPKKYRGYGYATSCVAKLSERMLEKYRFCTLFTDQANPTSNSIYLKIGYKPIEEFRQINFTG